MQRPIHQGNTEHQTAWTVFVIGIILNDFAHRNSLTKFSYTNVARDALINGVLRKLKQSARNSVTNFVNYCQTVSRFSDVRYRQNSCDALQNAVYKRVGKIRTVAENVSPGVKTITPAGMPCAAKLMASVGQVYGSKQITSRPGGV